MKPNAVRFLSSLMFLVALEHIALAQQEADSTFDASVARPAYTTSQVALNIMHWLTGLLKD